MAGAIDEILTVRERHNANNATRTAYYLDYYSAHPDVPWALLAHFVSRNAGRQMRSLATVRRSAGDETQMRIAEAMFAFLEVSNFLIFRDVAPALEIYARSKRDPGIAALYDHHALDLDPFISERWRRYTPRDADAVRAHVHALVINEQNQIEDRLVNDRRAAYLGAQVHAVDAALLLSSLMQRTRIKLPEPEGRWLFTVGDFRSLVVRVQTGRLIYERLRLGLERLHRWARDNAHAGAEAGGEWYESEHDYSPRWARLYRTPILLPVSVASRPRDGDRYRGFDITRLLGPLEAHDHAELARRGRIEHQP